MPIHFSNRAARAGGWVTLLCLTVAGAPAARAQRASAPVDSTSARCMDVSWLNREMTCEGRLLNAVSLSMLGAGAGAATGFVGGSIVRTTCIGDGEQAAVRGAIAGAATGLLSGLVIRHISRRELAEKDARSRAEALRDPPRPWSWRDMRPAVIGLGVLTGAGAVIGATQGTRPSFNCGGVGGGMARGAAVYGGGSAATVIGAALVVRFLF